MLSVALTGGIGSGKSEVSRLFANLDTPVIDTDSISHQLVEPGQPALEEIKHAFGTAILADNGQLRRDSLRQQVFSDTAKKQLLENIMHPKIRQQALAQIRQHQQAAYVVVVVPLLVETGLFIRTDRILVVDCSETLQRQRVMARPGMNASLFNAIVASQASRRERLAVADEIIHNNGNLAQLQLQVNALHRQYMEMADSTSPGLGNSPY